MADDEAVPVRFAPVPTLPEGTIDCSCSTSAGGHHPATRIILLGDEHLPEREPLGGRVWTGAACCDNEAHVARALVAARYLHDHEPVFDTPDRKVEADRVRDNKRRLR